MAADLRRLSYIIYIKDKNGVTAHYTDYSVSYFNTVAAPVKEECNMN